MFPRSSIASTRTSAPTIENAHINLQVPQERQNGVPVHKTPNTYHSVPPSQALTLGDHSSVGVDSDELFTKHSISEVKFIQQRLRGDADAKQEELRLMVGERYRDLLQASTSIIAISRSSQRVKEALEETKVAILSQEEPILPRKPSVSGSNDGHLHILQLLSAHMKLLLDAPEHMWRLIERKKYYPAAWLLLLAGVVHRVLVRNDDDDGQGGGAWRNQGIDVLEQFPLIQRQWDAVSQFRSQIIHKATISLREHSTAVEDTCAALLTLHLLDSRPLMETFSVFLGQRTRTLQTMVSWNYQSDVPNTSDKQINGEPLELKVNVLSEFRRNPVNKIREATHTALGVISQTCTTARNIFHDHHPQAPLVRRVLEYIQSDSSTLLPMSLPPELRLTTQTLLTTLPSSTHLLLLPQSLRSYKPYVDLNSPASSIQQSQFAQRLGEWFHRSSMTLYTAVETWFDKLESIKELWSVRSSTRVWLLSSQLEQEEIAQLISGLDGLCQQRAIAIWRLKLGVALKIFEERLDSATSGLNMKSGGDLELSLAEFLFQAPPLPLLSHTSTRPTDVFFQKYKTSLRRQIVGRVSLLDELLSILERCATTIQQDLSRIKSSGNEAQEIVKRLTDTYRPEADILCTGVVRSLETIYPKLNSANQLPGLVLLGRVTAELTSSCPFISEIGCSPLTVTDFRAQTSALHDNIINRWQEHTVSQIVKDRCQRFRLRNPSTTSKIREHLKDEKFSPTYSGSDPSSGPSAHLIQSLLSLARSIEQLGAFRDPSRHAKITQKSLRQFIVKYTQDECPESLDDLAFLWKLAELQGTDWLDTRQFLDDRIETKLQPGQDSDSLKRTASEFLSRTQILFTSFLPRPPSPQQTLSSTTVDKFASLLPFGVPIPEQQFQSVIDSAKPSSRFGLLLVEGSM
ncbi:hypothetical protein BDZ94DRAFT_1198976 [Collybia nuda]|uniref:Conserved oligomeric Golgi complex subunit 1 n=1 Tax=Collybia nuda TaxID=64659 RepID=A0A9P5XZB1_9AGAR|nr:hypothetical protein BDZ94DRAFT_1198976 [Collybia nuda]